MWCTEYIRVRFAPSPTGQLHLGGVRTALINYLFAKNQKGTFIVRVEDTDQERGSDHFLKEQLKDLKWLGLNWDEGLDSETLKSYGKQGPYRQSERTDIYRKYAEQLVKEEKAYYCFLTDQEIKEQKEQAVRQKKPLRVISPYKNSTPGEAEKKLAAGEKAVIRFKTPEERKNYVIQDIVRGKVEFPSDMVGDFVILRSNGLPIYNFACVVDDYLMKISHVFRSEEHLANTLRQLMIYEAFSWPHPLFAHLSIILGEDGKKLSKRQGAVSCGEYREQGFLSSALLNFLALMGWNPKTEQEVFSMEELIKNFSLEGLNASPAVFDKNKLKWIQTQHIQAMDDSLLWNILENFFKKENFQFPQSKNWSVKVVGALKHSFSNLLEAQDVFRFLSENHFNIQESATEISQWETTSAVWSEWETFLTDYKKEELSVEDFSQACKKIQKTVDVKGKFLFMPLRTAILGQSSGAELKLIVPLIRPSVLLDRVRLCKKHFS